MISCHRLTKSYGPTAALRDVSFDAPAGEVTGLLGPNGCGKTTALKIIVGLSTPDSGKVVIGTGSDASRPVGAVLDVMGFAPGMRVRDVLRAEAMRYGCDVEVGDVLDRVGLSDPRQRAGTLSLGMNQRLRIAMALVVPSSALVLDEPLNGLDPQGIRWLRQLLRSHADAGGAVLFTSHLLNEAQRIVDRVVILDRGRVRADGAIRELTSGGSDLENFFFANTRSEETA